MLPSCIRRSDIVRRFVSALVAVVVLAGCSAARAATLVVNTTADSNDGAGSCSAGTCSLRDAISQAAAGDTITFNSAVEGTITLTSALPVIAQNLTIQGPGVNLLTISGASTYQVFLVQPSSGTISVSISGITIAQGYSAVAAGALAINANRSEEHTSDSSHYSRSRMPSSA